MQSIRSHLSAILAFVIVMTVVDGARAAINARTWNGPEGGSWETDAHWPGVVLETGAPVAPAVPGPSDHVVIPGDRGTVLITSFAPKIIRSLDMLPSVGGPFGVPPPTSLRSSVDGGQGVNIIIVAGSGIPTAPAIGIRVGSGNAVLAANALVEGLALVHSGGSVLLLAETGQIVLDGLVAAGNGESSPGIGAASGGTMELLAWLDVQVNFVVRAGNGGDAPAARFLGGFGGSLTMKSANGAVRIDPGGTASGGRGGVGFAPLPFAFITAGGGGGHVAISAKTLVENKGVIRAGDAGLGSALPAAGASGGNIELTSAGAIDNFNDIRSGAGAQGGGSIVIDAGTSARNRMTILAGDAVGPGAAAAGGPVTIKAKTLISNDPGANIFGGRGAPSGPAGPGPPLSPGRGGAVRVMCESGSGPLATGDVINGGRVTGGSVGAAPLGLIVPVAGANVSLFARVLLTLNATSVLEGGNGSNPISQRPRGDVFVRGWRIVGGTGVGVGQVMTGKRIYGTKKPLLGDSRGGATGQGRKADIDFSGSLAGAIQADELICLDAGSGGSIDLTEICAGTDALVASDEGGLRGYIHLRAGTIELDDLDRCTGERVTLDEITSPEAVAEPTPCECCTVACPADLDVDGDVDGIDLAKLLGIWTGPSSFSPCPPALAADLTGDCRVNGLDLAILLGAWGPCG